MDDRFRALAELAVHGANVQPGQLVGVNARVGQHELAQAVATSAYRRGARFVDVAYFDPLVKRARIVEADPDTLAYVPSWYVERLNVLAELEAARVSLAGVTEPDALSGLDPLLLGRDRLPWLDEITRVIDERRTNWTIVPCPHPAWAGLVFPDLQPADAYERLWTELWHVLRLDESDPIDAWERRIEALSESARTLNSWRFDALEFRGPGTELTVGLLPGAQWETALMHTRGGIRHMPNLPTEEVFTTPDPLRTNGRVTATKPLVLKDGLIVRGLRIRFREGRAVELSADENGAALRLNTEVDEGAARLGEVALVDSGGRIGPLGTVFYDTVLDENAASHLALGGGVTTVRGPDGEDRTNRSGIHIDFTIGSARLDVYGLTLDGSRVPVLVEGDWRL